MCRSASASATGDLAEIDGPDVGVGPDLPGTPGGEHGAAHQHRDPLREAEHEIHVVIDDEHGDLPREPLDGVEDDVALRAGHAGGGLVEQQHPGLEPEGDGDLQDRKSTRLNSSHITISY